MAGWDEAGPEKRLKNTLPLYGNKESMNLNSMILTNILGSPYFKEELINYKTFHEVVDEIYYKVDHLEPWEKNSRKLAGQVGMCAGVRGVAAGGIVSTAYCLLYKLFTLKLTRKQVNVMLNHVDSPYIRGLGFMYIRYCQPPADFWDWFGPYIDDPEEIDLKAGGGYSVTIGEVCSMLMTKLDWFGTLFPRMPVNVGRDLEQKIKEAKLAARTQEPSTDNGQGPEDIWGEAGRRAQDDRGRSPPRRRSHSRERKRSQSRERRRSRSRDRERRRSRSRDKDRNSSRSRDRGGNRSRSRDRGRNRSRSRDRARRRSRSRDRDRKRSRSRDRERRRSRSRDRDRKRSRSRERDRERRSRRSRSRSRDRKNRRSRSKERQRSRSRSRGRKERSRSREKKRRSRSRS